MAETKTETFRFPVDVKGYQVKQDMTINVDHPKVDGHITGMGVDGGGEHGTPVAVSRLMLHRLVCLNVGQQNSASKKFTAFDANQNLPGLATPFCGAGEERNVVALPP